MWILFSLAQRSVRQWSVLCANGLYLIWRYVELAAGQWNPHSCVHGYLANIGINFSIYYHQISYKNIWIFVFLPARRYASTGYSDRNVSVRPSVCLSVTCRYCVKMKKASIMISSPSGSPKTLVFWRQISLPNSKGSPRTGASKKGRSEKFSNFLALSVNISKMVADTAKVTISD